MTKLVDGVATNGVEEITGRELFWLKDAHEKFTTAEDDVNNTCADPGKGLAWLVVLQVLVYYLCSSIISTATYFGIFAFIYVKWVYPMSNSVESKTLEECVTEADAEPEWILDQFLSYIQQNKTDASHESQPPVPDQEPEWVVDKFLCYVQQGSDDGASPNNSNEAESDKRQNNETDEVVRTDNLVFDSQTDVSKVATVASSVTNTNDTRSEDKEKVEDMFDDGEDDFEIIDSDDLH